MVNVVSYISSVACTSLVRLAPTEKKSFWCLPWPRLCDNLTKKKTRRFFQWEDLQAPQCSQCVASEGKHETPSHEGTPRNHVCAKHEGTRNLLSGSQCMAGFWQAPIRSYGGLDVAGRSVGEKWRQ